MRFLQFVKEYVQEHPSVTFKEAIKSEDVKKLFHKKASGDKKPEEKKEVKKDDANIVINVNNNCGSNSSGSSGSKGGKKESSGRKPGRPRGSKTIKPGSGSANLPYAGQQPPRPPGAPFDPPAPPPPDVPVKKEIKEEKKKDKKKKILDDLNGIEQDIEEIKDDDDESHITDEDDWARRKDATYSPQKSVPIASKVLPDLPARVVKEPSAPPLPKSSDDLDSIDSELVSYENIYPDKIVVPQYVDADPEEDDLLEFMYPNPKGKGLEVGSDDEVDGEGIKKKKKTAKQIIKEYTKKQPAPGPRKYDIPRPELLRQGSLRDKEALLKVIEAMRLMLI